jgi:phosphatidylserine/phosphatidylglycerophosphate/cardiolipin synthase-like enzyme
LDNVREALIQAKNRGVEIKIVFDEEQAHGQGSEYSNLKAAGVDVRMDTGSGLMHDKVAIIDNQIIITGSFNWSQAGNQENNENLIVIDSSSWAAAYEQQFAEIWKNAET